MSEPLDPPATDATSMRIAGFGLGALGGLLMGVGSLLPWIRSSLEGLPDAFSPTYYGIDLTEGLAALAASVVVLAALATCRLSASPRARRVAASLVIVGSFVALAMAGVSMLTAADRFGETAVDDILADLDPSGNATDEQVAEVEELVEIRLAPGPIAVLGGGVLGIAGGALLLAWAGRTGGTQRPLPPPPSGSGPLADDS